MSNRAERRREQRTKRGPGGGGSSSSRIVWILGGVGVLAVLLVIWNVSTSFLDQTARAPVQIDVDSPEELLALAQGVTAGNPDAPVAILEFVDYQCPSCRAFFQETKPFLDMTYVEQGQARFVIYDFPLVESHPNAFLAARAARCAGDQDAYWPYHDRLFQTQDQWARQADPVGTFEAHAEGLGLDGSSFRSCLRSDRHAEVVTANRILGEQLGVQGTPSLLVDSGTGQAVRVQDWRIDGMRAIVDAALEQAHAAEPGDDR